MVLVGHLWAVEKLFQVSLVGAFGSKLEVKVQDSSVHSCLEIGLEICLVGFVLLRRKGKARDRERLGLDGLSPSEESAKYCWHSCHPPGPSGWLLQQAVPSSPPPLTEQPSWAFVFEAICSWRNLQTDSSSCTLGCGALGCLWWDSLLQGRVCRRGNFGAPEDEPFADVLHEDSLLDFTWIGGVFHTDIRAYFTWMWCVFGMDGRLYFTWMWGVFHMDRSYISHGSWGVFRMGGGCISHGYQGVFPMDIGLYFTWIMGCISHE